MPTAPSVFRLTRASWAVCFAALLGVLLAACEDPPPPAPQIRPVRTVTVAHQTLSEAVTLTGQIRARDEVSLGFRIAGRLIQRPVAMGEAVTPGQLLAQLESQDEENSLRSAQADLAAAEATLTQARSDESRQQDLLRKGFTTRDRYDAAKQGLTTAQSQVEAAQARLRQAQDKVSYTELRAERAGTVTATGAEPGEVVTAGQMVVQIARESYRDAVFDVPAQLIRNTPDDPLVQVALADDPSLHTQGRVRETSPQADPVTRTYTVKVALTNPPEAMRLGATVTGGIILDTEPAIVLPGSALTRADGQPAVWVVTADNTVALRPVTTVRYGPDTVLVSEGLTDGETVVTAGVQSLRPGQPVRLLGTP